MGTDSTRTGSVKNLHLIIGSNIVIPAGLCYGLAPDWAFGITDTSPTLHSVLKAVMGLYVAFALFWIVGIVKSNYWEPATWSSLLFMWGLVVGRIVAWILMGMSALIFVLGIVGEFVLGLYAALQLRTYSSSKL